MINFHVMDTKWKYDLYICAAAQDASWAESLSARIKGYRLPKNVGLPDDTLGYNNIYLDTGELEFTEDGAALLDACRYMLVICSPRAKNSQPLLDRLLYFEKTRAKTNIIAVIVEGEPIEAFPPFFIEETIVPHILPDGSIEERLEIIEPVASDLRGDTKKQVEQLFRYETVRIVASMLGIAPDALEQRHNRRRKQRITALATTACVILLAVSAIFGYFGLKALHEGQIADLQTQESLLVSQRLMTELPDEFSDDPQALEYVYNTILDAVYTLYETGSANLAEVNAERVLEISDADSAGTLLRKASLLRLTGNTGAMAAYEAAAVALEFSAEDKNLFINSMKLLSSDGYGPGIYAENGSGLIHKGDVILSLNGENVRGAAEWNDSLSELIEGEAAVTVLRPGAEPEELTADRSALAGLSVLGV